MNAGLGNCWTVALIGVVSPKMFKTNALLIASWRKMKPLSRYWVDGQMDPPRQYQGEPSFEDVEGTKDELKRIE